LSEYFLSGVPIFDVNEATNIYNDNDACVGWLHNMTSKAMHHIELSKNSVCEWIQDQTISIHHILGKMNPANIFTKEMRNGVHFTRLMS
jgi:hypothetical protein